VTSALGREISPGAFAASQAASITGMGDIDEGVELVLTGTLGFGSVGKIAAPGAFAPG
jgi:hypothetical protein